MVHVYTTYFEHCPHHGPGLIDAREFRVPYLQYHITKILHSLTLTGTEMALCLRHIPQIFHYLSLSICYALVMRRKKTETGVHGC